MMPPSRLKQLLAATDLTPEALMATLRANDCLAPIALREPERVTSLLEGLLNREFLQREARQTQPPSSLPGAGMTPPGASIYDEITYRLAYYSYLSPQGSQLSRESPSPPQPGPGWWTRLKARLRPSRRSEL